MSSFSLGLVVPIPTLPEVSTRMRSELPVTIFKSVLEIVPTLPRLSSDAITVLTEFVESLASICGFKLPTTKIPSEDVPPTFTSSFFAGLVVPIPTLPASVPLNLSKLSSSVL